MFCIKDIGNEEVLLHDEDDFMGYACLYSGSIFLGMELWNFGEFPFLGHARPSIGMFDG